MGKIPRNVVEFLHNYNVAKVDRTKIPLNCFVRATQNETVSIEKKHFNWRQIYKRENKKRKNEKGRKSCRCERSLLPATF